VNVSVNWKPSANDHDELLDGQNVRRKASVNGRHENGNVPAIENQRDTERTPAEYVRGDDVPPLRTFRIN